jgi:hypothetical protein
MASGLPSVSARVEMAPDFPAFFENGVIFSTRYIRVFPVVFLGSKNVFHGEAPFSRRKRGFLSRVFAIGQVHLFVIII